MGFLLLIGLGESAFAEELMIGHYGNVDPASEGWVIPSPASGQNRYGSQNDMGVGNCAIPCPFWAVEDNGTGGLGVYAGPVADLSGRDWEVRARVRVEPRPGESASAPNFARSMYIRLPVPGGTQEYAVMFGHSSNGKLLVQTVPGSGTLPAIQVGSTYDYHDVRIVYNAAEDNADIVVDGLVMELDIVGRFFDSFTDPGNLYWGSGYTSGRGFSYWNSLELVTNPDSDDDGLVNSEELVVGSNPFDSDTDDDGLSDADEIAAGTDVVSPDSDDDGLNDGFEVANGLNPLLAGDEQGDLDNDGLSNVREQELGTNGLLADSDGDGLDDGDEVDNHLTDPLLADTDRDGLSDGDEIRNYGSDPLRLDSDADSIPDGEELSEHGTNPAVADSDADGLDDGAELLAGTNPVDPDTDDDGLLDGFENRYQFDPLNDGEQFLDGDGDGLDNISEQMAGSNPLVTDSDDDGLPDGQEYTLLGTNPMSADSDRDGLLDGFEVDYGFDPNIADAVILDADQDGLTTLDEQTYLTNPLLADTDNDGYRDGEEVYVLGTSPRVADIQGLPVGDRTPLRFEAVGQPLFQDLPEPLFVGLDQVPLQSTFNGRKETINQQIPLSYLKKAWETALQRCRTTAVTVPVSSYTSACKNFTVTPSETECRTGIANIRSRPISCCTLPFGAGIDLTCSPLSYYDNWTIRDLNDLPGGPYVAEAYDLGIKLPPEPTQSPPPEPRTFGAMVTQNTSFTGGFTLDAGLSAQDPGEVDVIYQTDALASVDRSVVAPGETFQIRLGHKPEPFSSDDFSGTDTSCAASSVAGSCMSSRFPSTNLAVGFDFGVDVDVQAEIWGINSNDGSQYHDTVTVMDERFGLAGEAAGLSFSSRESLQLRLFQDVSGLPDWVTQEITIDEESLLLGSLLKVGTRLPIELNYPYGCFIQKVAPTLCSTYFPAGIGDYVSSNLLSLQLRIPEVNTPVSNSYDAGLIAADRGVLTPLRHALTVDGVLKNTLPNGVRPPAEFFNVGGRGDLSSDVARFELDLDGVVCLSTAVCLGAQFAVPGIISIGLDLIDLDSAVWAGWDQALSFDPKMQALISFDQPVSIRAAGASVYSNVAAGEVVAVAVNSAVEAETALEVIQPPGGVGVNVRYSFENNQFVNTTTLSAELGLELSAFKVAIGGFVGAAMSAATGTPFEFSLFNSIYQLPGTMTLDDPGGADYSLTPVRTEFQGAQFQITDLTQDLDRDGLIRSLEIAGCTIHGDADTDDDGLIDGIEDRNRNGVVDPGETDPCRADSDGDGLQDGAELGLLTATADTDPAVFTASTMPTIRTRADDPDSDDDGLSDGLEVLQFGTNPLLADSDLDGLSDSVELNEYGSDPLNPDTDGDGILDGLEISGGTDPLTPDTLRGGVLRLIRILQSLEN